MWKADEWDRKMREARKRFAAGVNFASKHPAKTLDELRAMLEKEHGAVFFGDCAGCGGMVKCAELTDTVFGELCPTCAAGIGSR